MRPLASCSSVPGHCPCPPAQLLSVPGVHPWGLCPNLPQSRNVLSTWTGHLGLGSSLDPSSNETPPTSVGLFLCCANFTMRTPVLLSQLKVCELSHAVALVPYFVTWHYQEKFGSITFPAVLPKAVDAVTPHPSPSHHLYRIPCDSSTPLLRWLERTGHKSRGTHPKAPCQAQELHPKAELVWLWGSAFST